MKKSLLVSIIAVVAVVVIATFLISPKSTPADTEFTDISQSLWFNSELKDVITQETFTISQFDKPVLVESFAVWCPTCTKQQREIKKYHDSVGDEVISVSLDVDESEDEAYVLQHTQDNGFDWYYIISPIEATVSLIDDFGPSIVNAPSAPMILICPGGQARKLQSGVKDVSDLKEAVATCGA